MKSAQTAQANWQAASGRAQTAWVAGINGTNKDQAALAAAAQPRWLQGVQDAAANNRFANGVTRRGTGYWKSQSEAKAANYSGGYTAGGANYGSAIGKLMADMPNIVSALPPRGDINANLQRVQQLDLALHQNKGKYKAG
jgi:hypothetical protein